jgi:hypothetical protein
MDQPGVNFARAHDGAYLAYQVFGDGPIDLVWQDDFFAIVDEWWYSPPDRLIYESLAEFARVILHDRRGIGCSSREGGPANLETRVSDTLVIMDAVGAEQPVVGGLWRVERAWRSWPRRTRTGSGRWCGRGPCPARRRLPTTHGGLPPTTWNWIGHSRRNGEPRRTRVASWN